MASYNRVIIMGNLTRDPDYKQLPSGQALCRLGLASNRQFKNKQTGAMIQEVCFVDVDVWGPQADSCNQYLQKGKNVLVEGRLKFDSWIDNNGQKRNKHIIVADRVTFVSTSASTEDSNYSQNQNNQSVNNSVNNFSQPAEQETQKAKQPEQVSQPIQAATTEKQVEPSEQKAQDTSTGEINFKDEKPFEDDLPF